MFNGCQVRGINQFTSAMVHRWPHWQTEKYTIVVKLSVAANKWNDFHTCIHHVSVDHSQLFIYQWNSIKILSMIYYYDCLSDVFVFTFAIHWFSLSTKTHLNLQVVHTWSSSIVRIIMYSIAMHFDRIQWWTEANVKNEWRGWKSYL